ncbi:MAG: hypothetical protein MUC36_16275, partial [Planctomycetes bacterium]|nr:hypothetical protein [Planctomycetota bacterium]
PPAPLQLGDPLPGLTSDELAAFERGKLLFKKRFGPSEGLGPLYNATSCESCHSKPVMGGTADLYRNFYVAAIGEPTFQANLPGLPSQVIPAFGSPDSLRFTFEGRRKELPTEFSGTEVVSAQRNSVPLFGVGLFEFISNATILANADPEDADGDGISGRHGGDAAGIGRFGQKSQSNNIEFFTRAPLMNQMGITSDPFRGVAGTISLAHGMAPQGSGTPNASTQDADGIPDPEISPQDLGDLIAFSRFLAPPQPQPFDDEARAGEATFAAIGCAKCHIPELPSSRGPVRAYTDLLIHDMGPELADRMNFGRPQLSASSPTHTGFEFRTMPLWGVSKFGPHLHDGRAATLDEAIRAHGGEGQSSRDAYAALTTAERAAVLAFLEKL